MKMTARCVIDRDKPTRLRTELTHYIFFFVIDFGDYSVWSS